MMGYCSSGEKMIQALRFLQRIRLPHSRTPFYGRFEQSRAWLKSKSVVPALHNHVARVRWNVYFLKNHVPNFCKPGRKFTVGSICGVSVVYGSVSLWPHIAHSMDGLDVLVDDHDMMGGSDREEDPHAILTFSRKLWLPVFLFLTVVVNWNHPALLAAKVIFFLLSTKPRPLSVYVFVEKLRRRSMSQHPLFYTFNSLHANKVDVEDYAFLCLARIELKDQKFTLIGILGGWWVLPSSPLEGKLSVFGNTPVKNYFRY